MKNIKGSCLCGKNELMIHEYGNFVYACHCDMCRKMAAGPVMAVDPESSANVVVDRENPALTRYQSSEDVERGFCNHCGSYLFWHHQTRDHYCLNAELFDDIVKDAAFGLQLFYDRKPAYYDFANDTRKMSSHWQEL